MLFCTYLGFDQKKAKGVVQSETTTAVKQRGFSSACVKVLVYSVFR